MSETANIAALLEHSAWMRRLARSLVGDGAAADDLVQETWLQALRSPPRAGRPARPWLGEVLRNLARARFRGESRRARREEAAADPDAAAAPADRLLAAVEQQRLLAGEVLALEEPYRTTLLLRFYEELTAAAIAKRQSVPAGTVRWRLKEGLDRLRARLDKQHEGDRGAWVRALTPLTADGLGRASAALKGAWAMKIGSAVVIAAGATIGLMALKHDTKAGAPRPPAAAAPAHEPAKAPPKPARAQPRLDPPLRADWLKRIAAARRAPAGSEAPVLDAEYIRGRIRELTPLLKECYETALRANPTLTGRLLVHFKIVGDPSVGGLVAESRIDDARSTIADRDLRECVQETMYAASFAPPEDSGEVQVDYPFVFVP